MKQPNSIFKSEPVKKYVYVVTMQDPETREIYLLGVFSSESQAQKAIDLSGYRNVISFLISKTALDCPNYISEADMGYETDILIGGIDA